MERNDDNRIDLRKRLADLIDLKYELLLEQNTTSEELQFLNDEIETLRDQIGNSKLDS